MPQQETFFEHSMGGKRVFVLKSYDRAFAREAFDHMDAQALRFLARLLEIQEDTADTPLPSSDFAENLWEEIQEGAREEWNSFSYFVVSEESGSITRPLFVSPDWPSAESFAKHIVHLQTV